MKFLARFVSVVAVIGVLVIPVSTVAAENAMLAVEQAKAHAMAAMDDMDDMECCPHAKSAMPVCGMDCPLVVICLTSAAAHPAKADWVHAALHWSALDFAPFTSDVLASLEAKPPSRPPKV
jgi:hypothetical protein